MKGRQIPYSAEELAFIQSVSRWPRDEALAAFSQKFGRDDVSLQNFNALCKRKGWLTGRTGCFAKGQEPHNKGKPFPVAATHPNCRKSQFKTGGEPHNTNYLGHERISKDGYVEVSIAETNPHTGYERRYVLKHRHEWEKVHGPIPSDHALKCLDGDKTNTDPSNWELIPRALLPLLNGGRFKTRPAYDEVSPELKPALLTAAKVKHRVRQIKERAA